MNRAERVRLSHVVGNAAITGALLVTGIQPLINHETSERVLQAAWGTRIECDDGVEPINAPYLYDVIAVPGAGLYFNEKTEKYEPNSFEKRRLHAAALAFVNKLASKVILLDGQLEPGADPNVSLRYLQDEVHTLSNGKIELSHEAAYIDAQSINTPTNMDELERLVQLTGFKKVLIITDQFHSIRSILLACAREIHASYKTVEELTAEYEPLNIDLINKPNLSGSMRVRETKELVETLSMPLDQRGDIFTLLKHVANSLKNK